MSDSSVGFREKIRDCFRSSNHGYSCGEKIELLVLVMVSAYLCAAEIHSRMQGRGSLVYVLLQQQGFVSSAILGCGILLLRPLNNSTRWTILSVTGVISLSMRDFHPLPLHTWEQSLAFTLTPVAAAVQLAFLAAGPRDRRPERRQALVRGLLLLGGVLASASDMKSLGWLNPTYDAAIFNMDQHLLVRIPSIAMHAADSVPRLYAVVFFVYSSVPAIIAIFDVLSSRRRGLSMTLIFSVSGYVGSLCYHVVPSAGPPFLVPGYYRSVWATRRVLISATSVLKAGPPRNCMPSLHAAWAYLLLVNLRFVRRPIGRLVIGTAALLTILAALTAGQHWFVDLIVALPFAVSVDAFLGQLPRPSMPRALIGFVGAVSVGLWFWAIMSDAFVRLPIDSGWIAIAVTSLGSVILFRISSRFDAPNWTADVYRTNAPLTSVPAPSVDTHD